MATALKVIGAGFGRTGTLSLKVALEQLGFSKCHHMQEVMASGRQTTAWFAISHGADLPRGSSSRPSVR